jgi:hypothetical protein
MKRQRSESRTYGGVWLEEQMKRMKNYAQLSQGPDQERSQWSQQYAQKETTVSSTRIFDCSVNVSTKQNKKNKLRGP